MTDALQNSPIINLALALAHELLRGRAQHVPVLFEDAEIGRVAGFAITWDLSVSCVRIIWSRELEVP